MGFTERCTDTIVDFEVHLFKEDDVEFTEADHAHHSEVEGLGFDREHQQRVNK